MSEKVFRSRNLQNWNSVILSDGIKVEGTYISRKTNLTEIRRKVVGGT